MATETRSVSVATDRSWFIAGRWQEYDGEFRVNLLRIIGIGVFYLIHLAHYHGWSADALEIPTSPPEAPAESVASADRTHHLQTTLLAVAWTMVALGVHSALRRRIFPGTLKYVSTGCDLVLLTAVATIAEGPRSPLVAIYFLVIAAATLRFQLRLVWCATLGSLVGYLFLLGHARWFDAAQRVPRYQQLITLAALALTGVILGQTVRRVRALAEDFALRAPRDSEGVV